MPPLRQCVRGKVGRPKGVKSYPLETLFKEVAFIAYHFNWSSNEVMEMPHWERRSWCDEISGINRKLGSEEKGRISL